MVIISTSTFCIVLVVSQYYVTEAENEYVIRGNSAVMKCKIPSFVADFVQIDSWIADDGHIHKYNDDSQYGTFSLYYFNGSQGVVQSQPQFLTFSL